MFKKIKRKKIELLTIALSVFVFILILFGWINIYKSSNIVNNQTNSNLVFLVDNIKLRSNNYFSQAEEAVEDSKAIIESSIDYKQVSKFAPIAYKYDKYNIPYLKDYFNSTVKPTLLRFAKQTDGLMSIYLDLDHNLFKHKDLIGLWYADENHNGEFELTDNGLVSTMLPENRPDLEWYYLPKKLKKGVWSAPYFDADLKTEMITYSAPIYSGKTFLGIVGADISMNKIKDFVLTFKLHKSGKAYLIDKSGKIIFAKDYKPQTDAYLIDKNLYKCLNETCKELSIKLDNDEIKLIKSESSDKLYAITNLYNDFFLVIEVKRNELYGETNNLVGFTSYSLIFAIIIALFIAIESYVGIKKINAELMHKEKLISIGTMTAKIAHEVNNPLGYVSCNIETLKKFIEKIKSFIASYDEAFSAILEGESEIKNEVANINKLKTKLKIDYVLEALDEIIDESKEGINRVSEMVVNLKNFSKDDGAAIKANENLEEIINESLIILNGKLVNSVEVTRIFADIPPLCCNKNQMKQVLINMIDNAYQSLQENENAHKKIIITTYKKGRNAFVEIEDNGIGIDKNKIKKVFDTFFTTKAQEKGTGLGLSIAYEIVTDMHNGEISVESKKGKGAKFTIKIPYKDKCE